MDVVELLPRLHHLRFPVGNAYLWRGDDGLTLIDAGVPGSATEIAAAIRGLGHRTADVRRLFLTHFHEDHIGGAAEVAGWGDVTVYAHRADASFIRGEAPGPPAVLLGWERELFEQVHAGMSPRQPDPVRVDKELAGGEVLAGDAHVVAVPGHTPGSAALFLPGPGVLFTGDTIAREPGGEVILGVFNVDRARAIESFRTQAAFDVRIACFGHGEPLVEHAAETLRAAAREL
jgi:glyoxylase-like metal-dependent hydrolase (beta-lactamase superfamily II)